MIFYTKRKLFETKQKKKKKKITKTDGFFGVSAKIGYTSFRV